MWPHKTATRNFLKNARRFLGEVSKSSKSARSSYKKHFLKPLVKLAVWKNDALSPTTSQQYQIMAEVLKCFESICVASGYPLSLSKILIYPHPQVRPQKPPLEIF